MGRFSLKTVNISQRSLVRLESRQNWHLIYFVGLVGMTSDRTIATSGKSTAMLPSDVVERKLGGMTKRRASQSCQI